MEKYFKKEGRYSFYEAGEGTPIVVLHGLMGGLSNLSRFMLILFLNYPLQSR